jgi:urea transport system ATP-binding protein
VNVLDVRNLRAGYRGDLICQDIDLHVGESEAVCVLGRNGVGKSTLLKAILGLVSQQADSVRLAGHEIAGSKPYRIARMGIGYIPQGRQLFGQLTVRDNLRLGSIARSGRLEDPGEAIFERFPRLRERLDQQAGTLSGGEQQMVAIARILAARPRLLLCDEPSEGLQPSLIGELARTLRETVVELGVAILLVEQNIELASSVATRGYIMEGGRIVKSGPIDQITTDEILHRHVAFSGISRGRR